MQYTQCLSLNAAIPVLCTGQALTCKCNGPENGVVWSNIFGHVVLSLICNNAAPSPILDTSVLLDKGV